MGQHNRVVGDATMNEQCTCGHPRELHFRSRLSCMHSTPTQTWACDCDEYIDASLFEHVIDEGLPQ